MKHIKNIAAFLMATAIFTSCKDDFLQDGSLAEGPINAEQTWANDTYARGILNNAYFSVQDRFSLDGNGAMQASGSDEAVNSNLNSNINTFNNGTWSSVRTIDDTYSDLYEGLRKVNLFIDNVQKSGVTAQPSELASATAADQTLQAQIDRLKGQAFFLRAYFHFELLERYGSLVLATRVFDRNEDLNLPRNTFQECVDQIALDCDSAITRLPLWTQSWSSGQRGRVTQTAAMALKARTFLYAASPQYNTSNDVAKWQKAADAAKLVIDKNVHSLLTDYRNPFLFGGNPYNNEVIFETQTPNRNDIEQNNAPISYDGALGRTNPTQDLVDAFEMKTTGRPISDPTSGYNAANPYTNRDPRFGFTIFYNSVVYKSPKTVDIFTGGKDGIGANVNATKTGYYMRKFFNDAVTWNQASNTLSRRPWVIFRYAEILLNYAEALNEAQGPVADVYKYVNLIRQRTGVALPALQSTNPTGNGYVAATKEAMRLRIQNERRIELCFEGHRFFDVRRWKKGEEFFNKPVSGMKITKNASTGAFTYEPFVVENRVFTAKNYLYPISQSNLNRAPALRQNPGY
jgi:hypothetical protein